MGIAVTQQNFHHRHIFEIQIDGFKKAEFSECSNLELEVGKVEHWEGGSFVPNKSPGLAKFADVTLKRGVTSDQDIYLWMASVIQMTAAGIGSSKVGLADGAYKRNLDIVQKDRDGTELKRWTLAGAWPVKYVAGSWDNKAEEATVEEITLTFDYFDQTI